MALDSQATALWEEPMSKQTALEGIADLNEALTPQQQAEIPAHEQTLPTFIYSCIDSQLHRMHLVTGEKSSHTLRSHEFNYQCCWSELPGGGLLITGGAKAITVVRQAVKIDTQRELAVTSQPPMLTARFAHAAVSHSQHVYVLRGYDYMRALSGCERYVWAESRWEELPTLPIACYASSAVVHESSLYVLGGCNLISRMDSIQRLSLDSLTWELMQLRLPQAGSAIPCLYSS
jgi:hypothetical protein